MNAAARTAPFGDPRVPDRIWSKIEVDPATGCWLWTASLFPSGYGQTRLAGFRTAHRGMYTALVGAVSSDLQIDHLCRVRACCNPAHLEPVTCRENLMRSPLIGAKTHCVNGHPFTPENTRRELNQPTDLYLRRKCRRCDRDRKRVRRQSRLVGAA